MQYKGDDFDLRVPHAQQRRDVYGQEYEATAGGRWPRVAAYSAGNEPLWVDETLLAACNFAFDIAVAHGAGEVGLEHLVNALTRIEAASRILEARGVREAQLRRESATLIASEIPATSGAERITPRRGPDFEDVLRRASDVAQRRGVAAGVDDVLWVILHHNRDLPAVLLLRRMTPDWQRLEIAQGREVAVAAEKLRVAPAAFQAYDTMSGRIAQIEDSLRGLHADLAAERKVLADLIRDAQRDIVAQRGDAASLRSDMAQRLDALERGLQARTDTSRLTVQLSDRVQSLEKAVHGGLGEGARNWAALSQRLQAIETAVEGRPAPAAALETGPILEQLTSIDQALNGRIEASARVWNGFADRLAAVEQLIQASAGPALSDRIGGLETAVRSGFGDAAQSTLAMTDRLEVIEARSLGRERDDEAVLILDDRMQSIERLLQDRVVAVGGEASGDLVGRLLALEQRLADGVSRSEQAMLGRDSSFRELQDAIARLAGNQVTLASAIADWRHESHSDLNAINVQIERMAVEPRQSLAAPGASPVEPVPAAADRVEVVIDRYAGAGSKAAPVVADEALFTPAPTAGEGHGFWWWLFGTRSVSQANRDAEIRWLKMHDRLKEARDRRKERA